MLRLDFASQDYLRDPDIGFAKLRAAGPVVEVRFRLIGRTWITTTSDLAARVLKDSENTRGQHADDGRTKPYAAAQYRR